MVGHKRLSRLISGNLPAMFFLNFSTTFLDFQFILAILTRYFSDILVIFYLFSDILGVE